MQVGPGLPTIADIRGLRKHSLLHLDLFQDVRVQGLCDIDLKHLCPNRGTAKSGIICELANIEIVSPGMQGP